MPITKQASRDRVARRGRDLADVEDGERRLDHRPEPRLLGRAGAGASLPTRASMSAPLDGLRQQDRIGRGRRRGGEIGRAPRRVEPVDADDELARAVAAGLDRIADLRARRLLGIRCHRVLEVEDQRVGGERLGLLQRAGVGARHVEDAAPRTHGHGFLRRQLDLRSYRARSPAVQRQGARTFSCNCRKIRRIVGEIARGDHSCRYRRRDSAPQCCNVTVDLFRPLRLPLRAVTATHGSRRTWVSSQGSRADERLLADCRSRPRPPCAHRSRTGRRLPVGHVRHRWRLHRDALPDLSRRAASDCRRHRRQPGRRVIGLRRDRALATRQRRLADGATAARWRPHRRDHRCRHTAHC